MSEVDSIYDGVDPTRISAGANNSHLLSGKDNDEEDPEHDEEDPEEDDGIQRAMRRVQRMIGILKKIMEKKGRQIHQQKYFGAPTH